MKNYHLLPTEILQEIFGYLKNKRDIESCLLVCRSWNFVASGSFWDGNIICLNCSYRCTQLLDTLSHPNSRLSTRTKHIKFDVLPCELDTIVTFKHILNLCTNLTILHIKASNNTLFKLLQELNFQEITMPYIEIFQIESPLYNENYPLKCLYTGIIFKYRSTITDLELPGLTDGEDTFSEYGGIYQYISSFPNLKTFKCYYIEQGFPIDLPLLLDTKPQLEHIALVGECKLTTETDVDYDQTINSSHAALKHIELQFRQMDLSTIKCIMRRLKGACDLSLLPSKWPHVGEIIGNTENIEEIFNQFTIYCNSLANADVYVRHGNLIVAHGCGVGYDEVPDITSFLIAWS